MATQRGDDVLLADARSDLRRPGMHTSCAAARCRRHHRRWRGSPSGRACQTDVLHAAGAPFVVWGPPLPEQPYCSVGSDDFAGGKMATQHLIRLGRQRIGFLAPGRTVWRSCCASTATARR